MSVWVIADLAVEYFAQSERRDFDVDDFSGFHAGGYREQGSEDRPIGDYLVARNACDDDSHTELLKIMLPLQFAINGHESVKRVLRVGQQGSVLRPLPADFAYGPHGVARKRRFDPGVHALV